jgi:predicted glycosyltransferase
MRLTSQEALSAPAIAFPCEIEAEGRPRILYYSPTSSGFGPVNRQTMLARAICEGLPGAAILLIGEVRQGSTPILPPGVDFLALPANGGNIRRFPHSDLSEFRRKVLFSAVRAFDPDVILVEQNPNGFESELEQTLEWSHQNGRPRTILLLQDVLPDPSKRFELENMIRHTYDFAWVLGDASVFNWVREYGLSLDLIQKLRYTGYPDHRVRSNWFEQEGTHATDVFGLPPGHLVLCLAGEGEAGESLAEAFSRVHLPPKTNGVIVCGSGFSISARKKLQRRLAGFPRMRLVPVNHDYAWLLSMAERIVAFGEYEAVSEILSFDKRGFVLLQSANHGDTTRAKVLQKLDLIEFLTVDTISPDPLSQWLSTEISPASPKTRNHIRRDVNLNALNQVSNLINEALSLRKIPTA